jgi:hypothetical protein
MEKIMVTTQQNLTHKLISGTTVECYVQKLAAVIKDVVGNDPVISLEAYRHNNDDYICMYIVGGKGDFPIVFTIGVPWNLPDPEPVGIDIWLGNTYETLYMVQYIAIAVCGKANVQLISE